MIGQAETFRARVAPLAQADADAYEEALAALRGREELAERYRDQQLRAALERAAEIPMRIAEAGCDLACLAALLVENGNPEVRADAAAACDPRRERRPRGARRSSRRTSAPRQTIRGCATSARSSRPPPRHRSGRSPRPGKRRTIQPWPNRTRTSDRSHPASCGRPGASPPARAADIDASGRVAGRGHARVGVGRLDRQGRARLHPRQRRRRGPSARRRGPAGGGRLARRRMARPSIADDTEGDLCGHGTACAGIVRALAPECELDSVRVLGAGFTGSGDDPPRPVCAGRSSRASTSST